jgi:DNA polymerase I-like protein with 3'-5' exonuclease and polymerase domains
MPEMQKSATKTSRTPKSKPRHSASDVRRETQVDRLNRPLAGLDTETTGLDARHGCRPYYISIYTLNPSTGLDDCFEWLWEVDPFTRLPIIPAGDIEAVQRRIDHLEKLGYIFNIQNAKHDVDMLLAIGVRPPRWENIEDPLVAHHLIASNESHALKDASLKYLGIPDDDEDDLHDQIVNVALPMARKLKWDVKKDKVKGERFYHPHFPTASGWSWKQEMWILRALAKHYDYPLNHPWWTLTSKYGMNDSIRVVGTWMVFREAITDEGLWPQYRERMNLLEPIHAAEGHGLTLNNNRLDELSEDFSGKLEIEINKLKAITPQITNFASPKQLVQLFYNEWELPVLALSKSKKSPGTDKNAVKILKDALATDCKAYEFLDHLENFRHLKAALTYLNSYRRGSFGIGDGWLRLHTTINSTGTVTTRLSTSNPSQQNVSKQKAYNLRYLFGPAPGRIWYSIDQSNVEMRLFAYCSGDEKLIKAFEDGYDVHLIFAEALYPREFAQCVADGVSFKDRYDSTLYQWIKNGNFALIYGAAETKANATYRLAGAYDLIRQRLPLVDVFIRKMHNIATTQGYVELLGGYRLQVPKREPHKASNYFIQGSAGWAIQVAMNRVWEYLKQYGPEYKMVLQVHDELVFDFPLAAPGVNERIISDVARIMEMSGDDIGIPLPVEVNIHPETWSAKEHFNHKDPLYATAV